MMTRQREGKVALVTGASQDIGAATAPLFAQAGAAVALASRSEEAESAFQADMGKLSGRMRHELVRINDTSSIAFALR